MKQERNFSKKTKKNSSEGVKVQTDTNDRLAGDSVNEHKAIEEANAFFAEKEIEQVRNNS